MAEIIQEEKGKGGKKTPKERQSPYGYDPNG